MLRFFKEKDFYNPFIIWLLVICWYLIFALHFFSGLSLKVQDIFTSHSFYLFYHPPQETENIVLVTIDEASRAHLDLKWPWKRSVTAQLIRDIASFSPKVIGLDIIFSGKSQKAEDEELISAFKSYPNIILGYVLRKRAIELPYSGFLEAVKSIGFVNKPLDENGILKNTSIFQIDEDENIHFSIDIEMIAGYSDIAREAFKINKNGISLGDKLFIPSQNGITPINYLVHYNDFTAIPAYQVLEKRIDPAILKDKIVLVGSTDPLTHDEYLTPLGIFPAISIMGNSIVTMLSRRFIYDVPSWQNLLIIVFLGVSILSISKKMPFGLSTFFTFVILSASFVAFVFLRSRDIQFDYLTIFFLTASSYLIPNIYKYTYYIYMRNKLKNLAIIEPSTGFYNKQFFLLMLGEELLKKSKSMAFLAVVIINYRDIILDLNFEESKLLIKKLAEYLKANFEKAYKRIFLGRISQDVIVVAIQNQNKLQIEETFKDILNKLNNIELKVNEKIKRVSLGGILIFKPKNKKVQCNDMINSIESMLKELRREPQKDFLSTVLEESALETGEEPITKDIMDFFADELTERNKELEKTLEKLLMSKKETEQAYFETIRSLIKALEEKDVYTEGHSERVANYAKKIAQHCGLDENECKLIYKASLLHDIGKIGIPDYILHKKGKLTEEEINLIRHHEIISVEILKPIKAFGDLLPIVLHHHEDFDGGGYPHGLMGEMIPKEARILAVADAFDAITCGRGYKKGKSLSDGMNELETLKGKKYDPVYVDALKEILKK